MFLALRVKNQNLHTNASLAADVLSLVATVTAATLSWLQHHRSEQPSTTLALYLSALAMLDISRVRTLWLIPGSSAAASVKTAALIFTAAALVLESTGKRASLRQPEKLAHSGPEPFIGFWGLTGYVWVLGTLSRGYRNFLSVDDLPALDYRIAADKLHQRLENQLKRGQHTKVTRFVIKLSNYFSSRLVEKEYLCCCLFSRICLAICSRRHPPTVSDWIQICAAVHDQQCTCLYWQQEYSSKYWKRPNRRICTRVCRHGCKCRWPNCPLRVSELTECRFPWLCIDII